MSYVDALQMTKHVRDRLGDLAVSENYVRDRMLANILHMIWAEGEGIDGLVSELWVEGTLPGEKSVETLRTLAGQGIFPRDLCEYIASNHAFPINARLYTHQVEALKAAVLASGQKAVLVVAAGTGQGKTEAFLLPVLSDLWTAVARHSNGGMRCLILYPLNALVADQVERIYGWLKGQERITVFHFTSETWEDAREANRSGEPEWEPCRMRTRQEARGRETHDGRPVAASETGRIPDIVITNYSMLEYMLCRPQDACFFGPDLRCIVLDEAHLYTGALAAEITMLLRRVRKRCGVTSQEVLQVATSATLGGTDDELRTFASVLFSADESTTKIFRGRSGEPDMGNIEAPPKREPVAEVLAVFSQAELTTLTPKDNLADNVPPEEMSFLRDIASLLASVDAVEQASTAHPSTPARFLYQALRQAPLVRRLAETLLSGSGRVLNVDALAGQLFPGANMLNARAAAVLLLRLSAAARDSAGEMPVIPHRLHFLVHAPEGLSVCLNGNCTGPVGAHLENLGCVQAYGDNCRYCQHILLPVHRCQNCGEWAMAGHESQERPSLEPAYYSSSTRRQTFYLLDHPRELRREDLVPGSETVIDTRTGIRRGHGAAGRLLWKAPTLRAKPTVQCCPTCMSEWTPSTDVEVPYTRQICGPLVGGRPFALSVVAETVLHDMPPFQGPSREWKPAQGRRLLCFSDSRRAAARLGPLLTRQHEIALVRAAIARTARDHTSHEIIDDVREEIRDLKARLKEASCAADKIRIDRFRRELAAKESELQQVSSGIAFDQFARLFAQRPEVLQLLDRDTGEKHIAKEFNQTTWESNARVVQNHAEALVATELDRPIKQRVHVEATGLVEVIYPGIDCLSVPPSVEAEVSTEAIRTQLRNCWSSFIHLILDSLRFDQCIGWSTDNTGRLWMGKSPLAGRWATRSRPGWNAHVLVGAGTRQRRRAFAANILRTAGCTVSEAERLSSIMLEAVFDQLYHETTIHAWLQIKANHQVNETQSDKAIRIALDKLSVRRPTTLFRCPETGTVWTRSALGWTWADGCLGNLTQVQEATLDNDLRWGRSRRELLESPYFSEGLWGEEHSAQLDPHENRRLQDLFKHGIRNILSSTTTMELGVDIGGLNGVLLGNVPPGPANHRQRAGRAGRRSDGSAVVVTYARDTEYDREVFHHFEKFLTKELRKPTVFLNRTHIVQRHLQAVLLSEFLRPNQPGRTGTMEAFGHMGDFCGVSNVPGWWNRGTKPAWSPAFRGDADLFRTFLGSLVDNPAGTDVRLAALAEGTSLADIASASGWRSFAVAARDVFDEALRAWRDELAQLKDGWDEILENPPSQQRSLEMAKANSIAYQVRLLCEITVIEWLADHRFLPRYGFPVNLQRLTVRSAEDRLLRTHAGPDERYKLERGSLLALREYVPGSRVLVGGRIAHSRGISKHWTDANKDRALGLDELAITCVQGHVFLSRSVDAKCPTCQSPRAVYEKLLFPRFGYTTAAWEPLEQETSFEGVGESQTYPIAFAEEDSAEVFRNDFGGIKGLMVRNRQAAQLFIRNSGKSSFGFALCTRCGYADSEDQPNQDGIMNLPRHFEEHASVFSNDPNTRCWQRRGALQPAVLRNRVIAAREWTDMLLIQWPGATVSDRRQVFSLGQALILAGTRLLELDHRELAMVLMPLVFPQSGIVIYDTSPGGTGHCTELLERGDEWIKATREALYVNEEHHRRCGKACLDCILDFSGQHYAHMLDRRSALELLDS